jgi:hypothetical protein
MDAIKIHALGILVNGWGKKVMLGEGDWRDKGGTVFP